MTDSLSQTSNPDLTNDLILKKKMSIRDKIKEIKIERLIRAGSLKQESTSKRQTSKNENPVL